jgi:hypothetical protein
VSPASVVGRFSLSSIVTAAILSAIASLPTMGAAQEIPRDEYFSYVPLEVPVAIRQTDASRRLHLFGDPSAPGYSDANLDGIDDARAELLASLALRFAPLLVLNSTAVPLDLFHTASVEGAFQINVDHWQNDRPGGRLTDADSIDALSALSDSCSATELRDGNDKSDCRLRRLLARYSIDNPESAGERVSARTPGESFHEILWVDYPGRSADEWNHIYQDDNGELPARFRDQVRTYVHPFISEVRAEGQPPAYEFVLQYWFFYPWNDGGNNHLGDWEHLNVVVSPVSSVNRAQTEAELLALLGGPGSGMESGPEQLVVRRLDYYFHSKVWTLDFAQPNAYAPRTAWEEEVRRLKREYGSDEWLWNIIRERAWTDETETRINTRPVGWIGADNKGLDQLLSPPGGTNRDSHGTFAMPGLHKEIGPAGAVESISVGFEPRDYWSASGAERLKWTERWKRGGVVDLAEPERIVLVPDVDRIAPLLDASAPARASWSWLVLPVRFGYPAVESPFAGIVSHAETGNLAVLGPAFNAGWNRSGESESFSSYEPDKVPRLFPLAWQDNFINSWGWLNLTAPTIAMFPPIDFLWRVVALPFRAILQSQDPTFYPVDRLPLRYLGAGSGYSRMSLDAEAYTELLINSAQFDEFVARLILYGLINGSEETTITGIEEFADAAEAPFLLVSFFIGDRFVSENVLRHSRSAIGLNVTYSDVPPQRFQGELNFWEYAGSFRYDVTTGSIRLFPKAGYGLSWYRIENLAANGDPFETPDSEWVRQPSLFDNLLPNTWHAGAGLEWIVLKNYAAPPKGIDLSVRLEWTWYTNKLGLDTGDLPLETLVGLGVSADQLPRDRWVGRTEFRLGATLSF